MGNKLTIRRDAAQKPPVCISKPPKIYYPPWDLQIRIEYSFNDPVYGLVAMAEDINLDTLPGLPYSWYWNNGSPTIPRLLDALIHIPDNPGPMSARLRALGSNDVIHWVETTAANPGLPPCSFTIYSWLEMSHPTDIAAMISPA